MKGSVEVGLSLYDRAQKLFEEFSRDANALNSILMAIPNSKQKSTPGWKGPAPADGKMGEEIRIFQRCLYFYRCTVNKMSMYCFRTLIYSIIEETWGLDFFSAG
jgi:hypothetical protein